MRNCKSGTGAVEKVKNPINAECAKSLRKVHKGLIRNVLSLRPLRKPLRAQRLKRLFQQPPVRIKI
jgi:hypothetical protein